MPSPDPKRRRLIDDSETPSNDWQKLLSGAFTPTDETKQDSLASTFNISPLPETPKETKTDSDGFAMPTPKLPSTIRSTIQSVPHSTLPSVPHSTLPSTLSSVSSLQSTNNQPPPSTKPTDMFTPENPPPNPLSTLMSTALSPFSTVPQSTRNLTPFTPSGDDIKDVASVPLNFRKLIITAYNVFEEETLIKLEDKQVKTHINNMLDGMKQKTAAKGDKLVLKLKELLDYIPKSYKGWQRSAMQKMFHRNFTQAVCLHLYRDDPDIDMGKIMKMNQFDNLKQQVLCLTPRRFGKTTSVAMFVAAYCLTVPRSEQCIFSTGRR